MKKKATLLTLLFITLTSFSQPIIEWQKSLGGAGYDSSSSIQQTIDGGYILAGISQSSDGDVTGNHGSSDYWIVKLSSMAMIEWQKSLGGSNPEGAYSIQQTLDGGYIVVGYSYSIDGDVTGNHGDSDYWVVKLSSIGEIEWQKSFGGSAMDFAHSVQQTSDGGYVVAGLSHSNDGDVTGSHGDADYWIVKLSQTGDIEWQNALGGSGVDIAWSVQQTIEGGYIVGGFSDSTDGDVTGNQGNFDYWIVKLSSTGLLEWQKSIGGSMDDVALSIQQTLDGDYIVAGDSASNDGDVTGNHGGRDYWIAKLNTSGTIDWQKSLGGSLTDKARSVQQTSEGGYIVAGWSGSIDGDVTGNHGIWDFWVVKLSATGTIEWQKTLGGSSHDVANSIQQTSDGGYIVAGFSDSTDGDVTGNHGDYDYWIVRLSPVLGADDIVFSNNVFLYPNPNKGQFSIRFSKDIEISSIWIIDALGKLVYSETNFPSEIVDLDQDFAPGIYFVYINIGSSKTTLKMVVE